MTQIDADATSKAFDAIHEEALRILKLVPADAHDVSGGLELIISLARYKYDIRSVDEIKKARGE
jgi:hypothetical protein